MAAVMVTDGVRDREVVRETDVVWDKPVETD